MSENRLYLIAGLGNPGIKYADTRHNVGYLVVDQISEKYSIPLVKKKFGVEFGRGKIKEIETILAKPQFFMNRSGPPIRQLTAYFRISTRNLLVIHDDIDLVFGRLKIKAKGGHGGHNGVRSIIDVLDEDVFTRLRIGIGRSENGVSVSNHVLGRFGADEKESLHRIIERARNAAVTILCEGTKEGMNRFNTRRI